MAAAAISLLAGHATAADVLSELPASQQEIASAICLPVQFQQGSEAYRKCLNTQIEARRDIEPTAEASLSPDEQYAVQQPCRNTGIAGSTVHQRCITQQIALIQAEPVPQWQKADSEERLIIQNSCSDIQARQGGRAYRRCVNQALGNLAIVPRADLSALAVSDQSLLQQACLDRSNDAPAYRRCLLGMVNGNTEQEPAVLLDSQSSLQSGLQSGSQTSVAIEPATPVADSQNAQDQVAGLRRVRSGPEDNTALTSSGQTQASISATAASLTAASLYETQKSVSATPATGLSAGPGATIAVPALPAPQPARSLSTANADQTKPIADNSRDSQTSDQPAAPVTGAATNSSLSAMLQNLQGAINSLSNTSRMLTAAALALPVLLLLSWLMFRGKANRDRYAVGARSPMDPNFARTAGQNSDPRNRKASVKEQKERLRAEASSLFEDNSSDVQETGQTTISTKNTTHTKTIKMKKVNLNPVTGVSTASLEVPPDAGTVFADPAAIAAMSDTASADDAEVQENRSIEELEDAKISSTDQAENEAAAATKRSAGAQLGAKSGDSAMANVTALDTARTERLDTLKTPASEAFFASMANDDVVLARSAKIATDHNRQRSTESDSSAQSAEDIATLATEKLVANESSESSRIQNRSLFEADPWSSDDADAAEHTDSNDNSDHYDELFDSVAVDSNNAHLGDLSSSPVSGEFGHWIREQPETLRLSYAIEFIIYWMAYSDERYEPSLRARVFKMHDPDEHTLIKRWVLQTDIYSFSDAIRWIQLYATQRQRTQIIDLLIALLVSEKALTPIQNTLFRFLGDAFGLGEVKLNTRFRRAFDQSLPQLPRVDKPVWWQAHSEEQRFRWNARAVAKQPAEIQHRVKLGLPLTGELQPSEIAASYQRAVARCHKKNFKSLGERELTMIERQQAKFEVARDALLEVMA